MNLDMNMGQSHSAPAQQPVGGDMDTIGFHPTAFDLDHILLEVQHGAILKMHASPPKSGKDLMTEVRKSHGSKEMPLKKAHVASKQALLSEIREHKMMHSLKHQPCKSCHDLMSEIRSTRGGDLMMQIRAPMRMHRLAKTKNMKSRQDMMTMLRQQNNQMTMRPSKKMTMSRQAMLSQIRAEHGGKMLLKPYKSIMKQVECPHQLKKAATTAKQSLLSQLRAEHGIYDSLHVLKHSKSPTKSAKYLMSEVRSMHGGKMMSLRKSLTLSRQSLLSQVRSNRLA